MLDVLEHVKDDRGLLRHYAGHVRPGGLVLITVPAFEFLWSGHDVFLQHERRYTPRTIHDCVAGSGLKVMRLRLFFGFLFPCVTAVRLARGLLFRGRLIEARSDMKPCPDWPNRVLIGLCDAERRALFPLNRLAGLSIFCLRRA